MMTKGLASKNVKIKVLKKLKTILCSMYTDSHGDIKGNLVYFCFL